MLASCAIIKVIANTLKKYFSYDFTMTMYRYSIIKQLKPNSIAKTHSMSTQGTSAHYFCAITPYFWNCFKN